MVAVSSWGRLTKEDHDMKFFADLSQNNLVTHSKKNILAYGMGRSYGDQCLNPNGILWNTTRLDKFIHFDEESGLLTCEAGVLLKDIQQLVIPRGWILPVSPGTQLITLGGAVANDVHGKNHHRVGSFGNHIKKIILLRSDGNQIECSPTHQANWFAATLGGSGLTGFILSAEIQLQKIESAWLETETIAFGNLTEFFALSETSEKNWAYVVSWVDCLSPTGRGLLMRANHTNSDQQAPSPKKIKLPLTPPISLVNSFSLKFFNGLYYAKNKAEKGKRLVHYESFFYPLDSVLEWNRIYGPAGFYQYQCVIPKANSADGIQSLLNEVKSSAQGSFLAVLKTLGGMPPSGMLSFPMPGTTLALDFPNSSSTKMKSKTHQLFERLDAIVEEAGGRIYLAKDARMPKHLFEAGYPQLKEFLAFRDLNISSGMSRRLMGF